MRKVLLVSFLLFITAFIYAADAKNNAKKNMADDIGKDNLDISLSLIVPKPLAEEPKLKDAEVKELKPEPVSGVNASPDLLVAYDKAIKADKTGRENPKSAIDAWAKVLAVKNNNPYSRTAAERVTAWEKFIHYRDLTEKYDSAKKADRYGELLPEVIIEGWEKVTAVKDDNPYFQGALKRIADWKTFISQAAEYQKKKEAFAAQRGGDRQTLLKLLPLDVIDANQKREMLAKYIIVYAPHYGMEDFDSLLSELKNENLSKTLRSLVMTPQFKDDMIKKCSENKAQQCYIAASLTEQSEPQKALDKYAAACKGGVVTSCVKTGVFSKNKNTTYFIQSNWIACRWGTGNACYELGRMTEDGTSMEKIPFVASKLYDKSCKAGVKESCAKAGTVNQNTAVSVSTQTTLQQPVTQAQPKGKTPQKQQPLKGKSETLRPYLWYGVGLAGLGVILAATGGGMFALASKEYDKYNSMTNPLNLINVKPGDEQSYMKSAEDHRSKGKTYNNAGIGLIVSGGAMAIAGTVLIFITKEKPMVSFYTDGRGVMLSYSMDF